MESKDGIVSIHGNDYETVALRVTKFRAANPNWTIKTKVVNNSQHVLIRASIHDDEGRLISTGHAEEDRTTGSINATSALENCETSAVGRALAFYDLPGTFLRSADEMSDAVRAQSAKSIEKFYGEWMMIIRTPEMLQMIMDVKDRLADGDFAAVAEIVQDMTEEQQGALRKAPTKGGILTTQEIGFLKSNEYAEARNLLTGHIREKS